MVVNIAIVVGNALLVSFWISCFNCVDCPKLCFCSILIMEGRECRYL